MNPEILSMLFQFNHFVIQKNTDGLTHADSMRQPEPGGNCINWVLGHIVATRAAVHRLLGLEPPLTKEQTAIYERGAAPLPADDARALPLSELLESLARSQEQILPRIESLGADGLVAPGSDAQAGDETVGSRLAKLQFHEVYHGGQIGILRRLAGHGGAIR